MKKLIFVATIGLFLMISCQQKTTAPVETKVAVPDTIRTPKKEEKLVMNDAATILSRKEVPILCYHNIKVFLRFCWRNDQNLYDKTSQLC